LGLASQRIIKYVSSAIIAMFISVSEKNFYFLPHTKSFDKRRLWQTIANRASRSGFNKINA
jgi:hypothetical protein